MAVDELTIAMRLRGARAANAELNATATSVARINAQAKRAAASSLAMGRGFSRTGAMLTRNLTLPVIAAGAYGVKMSLDFDTSLRRIVGLVGISRKTVYGWKNDMRDLSRSTGVDLKDIADGMFFVTSAGFRGSAAMRVLTASTRAAAAGLGDVHTVADAVTSAVNAYGEGTLKATKATDILVAGVREGKMPVDALSGAIGQVLGVASEAGVSFAEVTATAASLSRVGAPVNRTMTGIRFLLTSMINPTSKAAKVLGGVGISADQLRQSIKDKGLIGTLQMLRSSLSLSDFLKVVGGARGVTVALGLVGKHANTVNEILRKTKNSTGSTGKAFDAMASGPGFKLHKAINSLKVSLEEFGDAITPVVIALANGISKIAGLFGHMGKMGVVLLGALALLGPALKLVGFGFRIMAASEMLAADATFAETMATTGLTAALLALPITWLILGLVALGVGVYEVVTHFKFFKRVAMDVWHWLTGHLKWVALFAPGIAIIILVVKHFRSIENVAKDVWHWIEKIVKGIAKIHMPSVGGIASHIPGAGLVSSAKHLLGFADGGTVPMTGRYLVGERGPEVVTLQGGAHVTPNDALGSELVTAPIYVQIDRDVVAKAVARVVADRKARS
jgi:TP901 family phage tail tape measure protein